MLLVSINVIENVFTPEQKAEMIAKVTDAIVSIDSEAPHAITSVVIENVTRGSWGSTARGDPEDVHRLQAGANLREETEMGRPSPPAVNRPPHCRSGRFAGGSLASLTAKPYDTRGMHTASAPSL